MRNFLLGISVLLNIILLYLIWPQFVTATANRLYDKYTAVKCPAGYVCDPIETPHATASVAPSP